MPDKNSEAGQNSLIQQGKYVDAIQKKLPASSQAQPKQAKAKEQKAEENLRRLRLKVFLKPSKQNLKAIVYLLRKSSMEYGSQERLRMVSKIICESF